MMNKKIISFIISLVLMIALSFPAYAGSINPNPLVVDDAGVLTGEEKTDLEVKISQISKEQQFDVVVVIENSIGDTTPMDYADDYFDYNGYGYGADRDGCLLLVALNSRDMWISTRGFGITALTDNGIQYILNEIKGDLGDGDYYNAIDTYASTVDSFVTKAKDGKAYNKQPVNAKSVLIAIVIGLVIALIIMVSVKNSYKPVKFQRGAASYLVGGSLNVTSSYDNFLYTNVTKTRIETDNSSGGSSTHTSSSGATHGGGGGKF